jgi:2'-5' RNA ligase
MGTMMMSYTMYLDKTYILAELPEDLADDIISWGYDYVNDDFLYKENNDYGRTHNTHVTVLSDLKQQNVRNIKETVETESPFNCTLGNIKKFTTNSKFDVLYIEILNEEIKKIHDYLSNSIKHDSFYSNYIPHVTICYLNKGCGEKFLDNKYFYGRTFRIDELLFSSPESKIKLILGKKK